MRARTSDGWGAWSASLRVRGGQVVENQNDSSSSVGTSTWWLAMIAALIALLLAVLLVLCARRTLSRKQMSDVDVLDPYKGERIAIAIAMKRFTSHSA